MTYRMGDAIDVANLPTGLDAVAGYVAGKWPTYAGLIAKFPQAKHLSIAIAADETADCLDIENGDATNAQAAAWLKAWTPTGKNTTLPVLYTSASNAGPLIEAIGKRTGYLLWTAHYTNTAHVCYSSTCWPQSPIEWNADGTQWTDHGGAWDESLLNSYFYPAPPPPPPAPKPEPPTVSDSIFLAKQAAGPAVYVINQLLAQRMWISDPADENSYILKYGAPVDLSDTALNQYTPVGKQPGPTIT